jgi:hypothetical protein
MNRVRCILVGALVALAVLGAAAADYPPGPTSPVADFPPGPSKTAAFPPGPTVADAWTV